jgi:RNA polymerase sigma-70 factor, ECF subfamily
VNKKSPPSPVVDAAASQRCASPETCTEEQLAVRAQTGCAASFEQLVRRCQAPLVQFLLRRTRCRADAEDLAQETFVRAHRALQRYQPLWRFRTWLFTIGHRLSLNLRRRQVREEPMLRPEDVRSPASEVGDSLVAEESRRAVWQVVGELLDEEQVTILWLYYVEELSTTELGRVLGRSRGAVKTILFRARKKLMPALRGFVDGGGQAACAVEKGDWLRVTG